MNIEERIIELVPRLKNFSELCMGETIVPPVKLDDVLEAIDNRYTIDHPEQSAFWCWTDRGAKVTIKKDGKYDDSLKEYIGRTFLINFPKYNLRPIEIADPKTRRADILDFYKKNLKQKVTEKWEYGKYLTDQPKETKEFIADILKQNEV